MKATLDFSDDLTTSDLTELVELATQDGRSLGKLLKEAANHLVTVRRQRSALVTASPPPTPPAASAHAA